MIRPRTRSSPARIPATAGFATRPQFAPQMIERAVAAEVPFARVADYEIYGGQRASAGQGVFIKFPHRFGLTDRVQEDGRRIGEYYGVEMILAQDTAAPPGVSSSDRRPRGGGLIRVAAILAAWTSPYAICAPRATHSRLPAGKRPGAWSFTYLFRLVLRRRIVVSVRVVTATAIATTSLMRLMIVSACSTMRSCRSR